MEVLSQLDQLLSGEAELVGRGPTAPPPQGITPGMRDGSAHVLRCLKVWYDLPSDVFHTATANIDTFLAKMKAQPKHLSCIAVSSFHLACTQYQSEYSGCEVPDPQDLVTISQSRCSASDLTRMESILASKLATNKQEIPALPVTPLSFLRAMWEVSRVAAARLELFPVPLTGLPANLLHQLEILVCDSSTLKLRPCELALSLLCTEFQRQCGKEGKGATSAALMGFITELQKYCGIQSNEFVVSLALVCGILEKYNGEGQVPHRQRLVWKLSNRTLRHLRPTEKLRPTLPRISEESCSELVSLRVRSASECSLESLSDCDACCRGAAASDSESDIEMEEPRTWASIVAAS